MAMSPWQEASAGVSQMGNTINQLAVRMAQQKFREQQMQQQMMLRQQQMQEQQRHNRAQEGYYGAQIGEANARAGELKSREGINTAKVNSANALGEAMARQVYSQRPVPGLGGEVDMGFDMQLPMTHFNQMSKEDAMADAVKQAAISSALVGQPQRAPVFEQGNVVSQQMQNDPRLEELVRLILTKSRANMTVGPGAAPYNNVEQKMGQVNPRQFAPGRLSGQTDVNPNNAFNALRDPQFKLADPILQQMAWMAATNSPTGQSVMQGQAQPTNAIATPSPDTGTGFPPPEGRPRGMIVQTQKGTFRWNGQSWDPVQE